MDKTMHSSELTYVVESDKSPREALVAVVKAAHAAGWVVAGDYELSGLVTAGDSGWDVKSVDICQPDLARPFVAAQPLTALCMPCSILIYFDRSVTRLAVMRPSVVMPQLFQDAAEAVGDVAARIDRELLQILEAAR
jgi:uncharacterized protein (DUF302 family)